MDKIGKYKIESLVGRGAFGRVYRAFDPTVNRTVAIKVLNIEADIQGDQLLSRFRAEATTTGTLFHKNIVTVYDYGEQDGFPYLVMEHLQGRDLQRIIDQHEPMTLVEKVGLMRQVAEGLQYAHSRGIVHRDVKPGNIMVLNDGTVKLMDFGIARLMREGTRMTQQGYLIGTLAYMSPEQFQGRDVDFRTDLFAYGVIYYELITGQHPFHGPARSNDAALIIRNITSQDPPPICPRKPDCPLALEQIIFKAIHKDREQRYASLEDLLLDVTPIQLQLETDRAEEMVKEGEQLLAAGKTQQARDVARQALRLAPGNRAADGLRRKTQQQIESQAVSDRCEQIRNTGEKEFEAGNYPKAIEAFESALRLDPHDTRALQQLEKAKSAFEQIEQANLLLEQAQREIALDNLTVAARIADQFFDQARHLILNHQVDFPNPAKVHELMLAVRKAQEERGRRERLNHELALTRDQMSSGQWAAAVDSLKKLLVDYPGNNEITALLSKASDELKRQRKAEEIGRVVRDTRALIDSNEFVRAADLASQSLRAYPDDLTLLRLKSEILEAHQRHEQTVAIEEVSQRTAELCAAKRYSTALADLDRAIRTWNTPELTELRGRVEAERLADERAKAIAEAQSKIHQEIARGQLESARSIAQQASQDFPDEVKFPSILADLEFRIAEKRTRERIQSILNEADDLLSQSQFDRSVTLLADAQREFPAIREFDDRIAKVQEAQQRWRLKTRNDAIDLALSQSRERATTDVDRAISILEACDAEYPDDDRIRTALRSLHEERKTRIRSAELKGIVDRATSAFRKQDFEDALFSVQQGLEHFQNERELQNLARQIESEKSKYDLAIATRKALEIADRLASSGQTSEAVKSLENALTEIPSSVEIAARLQELQTELAKRKREAELATVIKRIEASRQAGNLDDALHQLDAALSGDPRNPKLLELKSSISVNLRERSRRIEIQGIALEARKLIDKGHLAAALSTLNDALERFPAETELANLLDLAREFQASAISRIVETVEQFMRQGQFERAQSVAQQGVSDYSSADVLKALLARVSKEAAAAERLKNIREAVEQAQSMSKAGNYQPALQLLNDALRKYPNDVELLDCRRAVDRERLEEQERIARSKTLVEAPRPDQPLPPPAPTPNLLPRIIGAGATLLVLAIAVYLIWPSPPPPPTPVLNIVAEPAAATIRIGGQTCSSSPCSFNLSAGEYQLEVVFDGYAPIGRSIKFGKETLSIPIKLTPLPPALNIATNLESGSALLDGKNVGTLNQGELRIPGLPDGDHEIIVRGPAGSEAVLKFRSAPGRIPELQGPIQVKNLVQSLAAATLGHKADLITDGKPKDVFISENRVGNLTSNVLSTQLPNEDVQRVALAEGDRRWEFALNLENAPALTVFLRMDRDVGSLEVATGEPGVDVFVNNQRRGSTDADGLMRFPSLASNTYDVRVQKDGFTSTPAKRATVKRDSVERVTFTLTPKPAELRVTGLPNDTHIWIDGVDRGVTPQRTIFQIEPGDRLIEFKNDAFNPKQLGRRFGPGAVVQLTTSELTLERKEVADINNSGKGGDKGKTIDPPKEDPESIAEKEYAAVDRRDPNALDDFRKRHAGTKAAADAVAVLANLRKEAEERENQEWDRTDKYDRLQLTAFRDKWPNGRHADDAQKRLAELDQDQKSIEQLIQEYQSEFNKRNFPGLQRIYPTIEASVQNTLKANDQAFTIVFKLNLQTLRINPGGATVEALRETTSALTKGEQKNENTTKVTQQQVLITFNRANGVWRFQSIRDKR